MDGVGGGQAVIVDSGDGGKNVRPADLNLIVEGMMLDSWSLTVPKTWSPAVTTPLLVIQVCLVSACIFQDAAGLGEAFPGFTMAFGAHARGDDDIFGLVAAGVALKLKNRLTRYDRAIGAVSQKFSVRGETFHADRHITLPVINTSVAVPFATSYKGTKGVPFVR
jgi:hypothetical protein